MLRTWLARTLAPEVFKDAERYDFLRNRVDDLHKWCGADAPEIAHAMAWAMRRLRVHFMSLDEYDAAVAAAQKSGDWSVLMAGDISKFREELRARAKQREAA